MVEIIGARSQPDVVLICEHASHRIPRSLDGLGLDEEARTSHVAWDPGAEPVAREMADGLAAPLILQRFSRLVYDCNRPPEAESAMPARSEAFVIPGNARLSDRERDRRTREIYEPFHRHVAEILDRSMRAGQAPAVVTIHSFTPVFHGKRRTVEIGFLHDVDSRLADLMLSDAADLNDVNVQRNQPYGPEDGVTHTLQLHAIKRGLPNVMIEIRNDLIRTAAQQTAMAARLSNLVQHAIMRLPTPGNSEADERRRAMR